jgi:hypothetical protein
MLNTWKNLMNDPQVALRILEQDYDFRQYVDELLPQRLQEILGETLTLKMLMEAQFLCADGLANTKSPSYKKIEKIRRGLSQYEQAGFFLETIGVSEEAYWQQNLGLNDSEYKQVQNGEWTVLDLLERRPALILAPLLRPTSRKH